MVSRHTDVKEDDDGWFTCCTPGLSKPKGFGDLPVAEDEAKLEFEQPAREAFPSARPQSRRPQTSHSARMSTWVENSYNRVLDRTTSFGSAAIRPWTSQSRRPTIGAPTNFRRVTEPLPARRRSFRPLELSIYLPAGRLSPLPDFGSSDWEHKLEKLRMPAPAILRGSADMDEHDLSTSFQIQRKPVSMPNPTIHRLSQAADIDFENGPGPTILSTAQPSRWSDQHQPVQRTPTMPPNQLEEMIASRPQSHSRSGFSSPMRLRSPSPFSTGTRSRSKTDPLQIRTSGSLRRSKPDTVDEAIRELNTIIEERRLSALNKGLKIRASDAVPQSPTHVPAIAPSMKVQARSETLNDIGSAFRTPLSDKAFSSPRAPPPPPDRSTKANLSIFPLPSPEPQPISTPSSTATALPPMIAMPLAPAPTLKPSTRSRLTTWLRRSVGTPSESSFASASQPQSPFYQLHDAKTPASQPAYTASSRASVSTVSSCSTSSLSSDAASDRYTRTTTPTTTIAISIRSPTSPESVSVPEMPEGRPSISKSGAGVPRNSRSLKRPVRPKRGLSIETTASTSSANNNAAPPPPPPYQKLDPHPVSPVSPINPGRVGVAF